MASLREVLQVGESTSLNKAPFEIIRRDKVTPAICYDDCNGAYKIAQSVGKSDQLCASGSTFMESYSFCVDCITNNADDATTDTTKEYVDPEFAQFIGYCDGRNSGSASTVSAKLSTSTEPPTTRSTVITITNTRGGAQTSILLVPPIASIPSAPESSCITCPMMTITNKGEVFTVPVPPTVTVVNLAPSSISTSSKSKSNNAAIIGPVVAVGVIIILNIIGILYWRRRRRAKKRINTDEEPAQETKEQPKHDKAQLHSDCVPLGPRYELEGSAPVPKIEPSPAIAEMTANEVAAHEMSAQKKTNLKGADTNNENV